LMGLSPGGVKVCLSGGRVSQVRIHWTSETGEEDDARFVFADFENRVLQRLFINDLAPSMTLSH
jgi:hypothetical protein